MKTEELSRIQAEDRLRLLAKSVPDGTQLVQVSIADIRPVLETMDLAIVRIVQLTPAPSFLRPID